MRHIDYWKICDSSNAPGCVAFTAVSLVAIALVAPGIIACGHGQGGDGDGGSRDASGMDGGLQYPQSPYEAVDLFVGTGGDGFGVGNTFPGATQPFSLVKLSPDTSSPNGAQVRFSHGGGYSYDDPLLLGFSHTHISGVGGSAYGNILFMPTVGIEADKVFDVGYRSHWSHETEVARPGYYAVTLDDTSVRTELTVGLRTGYHRWQWSASTPVGQAMVIIDVARAMGQGYCLESRVEILPGERRVRGSMWAQGEWGPHYPVYFDAVFDRDFLDHGTWRDGTFLTGDATADGTEVGAWVALDLVGDVTAWAQVGIAYTDLAGAQGNRLHEAVSSFNDAAARAASAWDEHLSVIEVEGGTAREQRIFYSALYHALLHPTQVSDHDERTLGFDYQIHQGDRPFYTDFSLWDTYRVENALLILLHPATSADMAQSLVRMAEQWGGLPRWPLSFGDSGAMCGTAADIVLAETYLKGETDFDVETGWSYSWERTRGAVCCAGRDEVDHYLNLGYVPSDLTDEAVSKTQEYNWADFALANLATALGRDAEAATLLEQSRSSATLWHEGVGFFRGRLADGSWDDLEGGEWSDTKWYNFYDQGNAWQYLWLSPHPDLAAELMGGRVSFLARLDEFFDLSVEHWESNTVGYWGPLPYYWHGNEPDLHAAYLYAAMGRPEGTQRWVRWIMATHYDLGPHGLAGNEDCGTLSAWYIFSALGFYPWPGSTRYYVGTPAFDRAVVHLAGGDLTITASDRDLGHYIQGVTLGGVPLNVPWFDHADIVDGGTLHFELGAEPSDWGRVE